MDRVVEAMGLRVLKTPVANITLTFVDYFDFSQVPVKDFHYYLCRILSRARHRTTQEERRS